MAWEQVRTDTIANNIANINTDGYQRQVAVGTSFGDMLLYRLGDHNPDGAPVGPLGNGVAAEVVTATQPAPLRPSESPLDVALLGPGEFTYQLPDGQLGYTRLGSFRRDAGGQLVTRDGYPVLVNGRPVGAGAQTLEIQEDGTVLVDGQEAGRLDIRGGQGTRLKVGALEASTVDLAQEMTDLITALRSYQINQRALQIQDQTLGKAVNELAKLS
jgi:flagellar basal-body rod protein FlgF